MKQVLQDLKTGETRVEDVPSPGVSSGKVLIATQSSLISAGTERMLMEFGRANLVEKARQQPDKVKMAVNKIKTDGIVPTVQSIVSKLDQPLPLGYSNVGVVLEVGAGVDSLEVGDRVVSNGPHAEIVCVPRNLCARIPDKVDNETACFTVVASIALQGVRLVNPTIGEHIVVIGLGLIGLITAQLLKANGCKVLGVDTSADRVEMAKAYGVDAYRLEDPSSVLEKAAQFSQARGVDGVLITASTKSDEPVSLAAQMCRKRGRIVLVGVTGLKLSRAEFYEKELTFQVSCSYGPGRYDPEYEDKGQDYPIGFVRWTEQRNFEAILDLMSAGSLDVQSLVSHRFEIFNAGDAYEALLSPDAMGIILQYTDSTVDSGNVRPRRVEVRTTARAQQSGQVPRVGFIGSGNYASNVLIPAFRRAGVEMSGVVSAGGVTSTHAAKKFGFKFASTDPAEVINDPETDAVVVATRHDSHAALAVEAISAGKHLFLEKPLAINREQLHAIQEIYTSAASSGSAPILMIGFNRRFSPLIAQCQQLLGAHSGPKYLGMTVNAGPLPADHWLRDPILGGGRIIGEGCHFVDLLKYLAGADIVGCHSASLVAHANARNSTDNAAITIEFADGSVGVINYFDNGHKSYPKERLEVFCAGRVLELDNFRSLRGYGWPSFKRKKLSRQNKGQNECVAEFINAVSSGGPSPIDFQGMVEVTEVTFRSSDQLGIKADDCSLSNGDSGEIELEATA